MRALRPVSPPAEYSIGVALQNRGVRTDFWRAFESVSVAAEFAFAMVWEVIGGATYPIAIWRDGKRIWQPTQQYGKLYFLATAAALRKLSRGESEHGDGTVRGERRSTRLPVELRSRVRAKRAVDGKFI